VASRWNQQRQAWLQAVVKEPNAHGDIKTKLIPEDHSDPERKRAKRTMKSMSPPYYKFTNYYPLEDIIDLYMQIWYDDSSSSDSSDS
jgi:hypothetical protein